MRLLSAAVVMITVAACEEPKPFTTITVTTKTGKTDCEAQGGLWSEFKTTQGATAEMCFRPPSEQVLASALQN